MRQILLIEDDKALAEAISYRLKRAGFELINAFDGEEGLEKAKGKPDLILLDIMLPKKGGMEVLEELKKDKSLSSIPVIIISNSGQPVEIQKTLALGAADYLIKAQFDPEEILEKIERVFNAAPARDENMAPTKRQETQKRVFLVEDDLMLSEILVHNLLKNGFLVEHAINGEEALKKIPTFNPDIVLLDILLPGIDGYEVLRRMKADENLARIPVYILSNLGQKEEIEKAQSMGADGYLIKAHSSIEDIIRAIKGAVKKP